MNQPLHPLSILSIVAAQLIDDDSAPSASTKTVFPSLTDNHHLCKRMKSAGQLEDDSKTNHRSPITDFKHYHLSMSLSNFPQDESD